MTRRAEYRSVFTLVEERAFKGRHGQRKIAAASKEAEADEVLVQASRM